MLLPSRTSESFFARVTTAGSAWWIQNNTVWGPIFDFGRSAIHKIIAFKVRRLVYDEIKKMDRFANFRGARFLGFCLNVLGLKLTDRHRGFRREFYPLQAAAVGWAKAIYKTLLAESILRSPRHASRDRYPTTKTITASSKSTRTEPERSRIVSFFTWTESLGSSSSYQLRWYRAKFGSTELWKASERRRSDSAR